MKRKPDEPDDQPDLFTANAEKVRARTMERAIRLLAAKPRSVRELRERLLEKQWTSEAAVDQVIEKLKGYKYLDDEQFARDLAMSKLRQRPQGRRRLEHTIAQKKLDKDTLTGALDEAFERMPEGELIDRAIEKRLRAKGRPGTREETKKFFDYLLRQGFDYGLIRDRMAGLAKLPADDDPDDAC